MANRAFTLIELSIVLVIIGLLAGVIVVGNSMIKSASANALVADITKITTSTTTFRTKYNGLPGDILSVRARNFGLIQGTTATVPGRPSDNITFGRGDGNGRIEGCAAESVSLGCETALFWVDLSQSGLIDREGSNYNATSLFVPDTTPATPIHDYLFKSRLRDTITVMAITNSGRNFMAIGSMSVSGGAGAVTVNNNSTSASLSPFEARFVDEKLDDGIPTTGTIKAITSVQLNQDMGVATPMANSCVLAPVAITPSYISTNEAMLENPACAIAVRTAF